MAGLLATLVAVLCAGCADARSGGATGSGGAPAEGQREEPMERDEPVRRARPRRVRASRCPRTAENCRSARGRVLYVEAVDPDGDGDAHLVLDSRQGITSPGLSVIDVSRNLRPRRLPRPGDEVTAAGPVYEGSYGQRQIQATEVHVARRRR